VAPLSQRRLGVLAIGLVGVIALTGCAGGTGSASGGEDGGDVTLRFTWWGGDLRHQMTQEVIDLFEAENPDITIEGEPGVFDGYFDKLATQVAAQDAPDIIQMPDAYFNEYVGRGALLDLTDQDIEHADVPDAIWNTGVIDGSLWGVPSGVNTHAIIANPALFAEAGLELPDDSTWSWDDYADLATRLSAALPAGTYGSSAPGLDQNNFATWLRQRGSSLFTDDGGLGFTADEAGEFFTFITELEESGAIPPAEIVSEKANIALEQTGVALGQDAMGFWASNQLANLATVTGEDLVLLRLPTTDGVAEDGEFAISGGWYTAAATTEHPEEVARFLEFMTNSEEAWDVLLTERGAPPNSTIRQGLVDGGGLGVADTASIEFLNDLETVAMDPPPAVPPVGAGGFQDVLRRYTVEVVFDRLTPEAAGEQLLAEAEALIR
jgi:multiple sugar transport system substrate-binding protein